MAVQFRAGASTAESSAANLTISRPTGTADGDFLVATVYMEDDSPGVTITAPSGWTALTGGFATTASPDMRLAVYYKIASSEPTSWTWTHSSKYRGGIVAGFRSDASATLELDAEGTIATGTTNAPASSVTTTVANTMLAWMAVNFFENAVTQPTGFTEVADTPGTEVAYKAQAAAGDTGSLAGSMSGGADWVCKVIAIREASGASTKAPPPRRRPLRVWNRRAA